MQSSVFYRDFSKAGGKRPMHGECAAITADEADEHVDVVGSSNQVHGGVDSERITFRESVSYAFLQDSDGVLDTSCLPLLNNLNNLIFTLL